MTKCIIEDCQVCLDRAFTMNVLTKIGFQQNFSNRINLLLNSRELCVINRGKLHNIFFEKEECDKAARPKTNLFILFLGFNYRYFSAGYADETMFFS